MLRATASDALYAPQLAHDEIDDIVQLAPSIPYRAALHEMLTADGLLLFQAAMCNHQIPAKLYEYFRAGRPILALTDPLGDTAQVLRNAATGTQCNITDSADIARRLLEFVHGLRNGTLQGASRTAAPTFASGSRRRLGGFAERGGC